MGFGTLSFGRLLSLRGSGVSTPSLQITASSVLESALSGSTVGVLSVANGSGSYTFTKTADPDTKFAVSGSNLNTAAALNYETKQNHSVTISASNGVDAPVVRTFTISVTNVFEAASLSALTGTFTLAENAALNAVAGAIGAKTSGSTLSLVDDAGGRVALSGTNIVRGATALDYETATSHSFTIRETLADSANSPRDTVRTLNVTDIDEIAPTITSADPSGSYAENTTISGTLTANETVTWSKSGTDAALVTLNTSTGVWSITSTPDYETKTSYSWTFIATDSAGNSSNQSVSIIITDVVEAATTVLTVLPNGDVVVESIGSTWVMVAERLPGGEISVTGGSGAAVFRYSIDGGVTWTEGTSPGIINELGEVIIEALGDAVESDPVPLFFEDDFVAASGSLAGRVSPTGGTWLQHPGSTVSHSLVSATSSIWQAPGTGLMTNNQATPSADYFVEADMKVLTVISGNSVACCGRFDSAALTYYAIRYTGTAFILFKSIAGTLTTLATYTFTQATGVTAVIRLEMNGDQISGEVDGVLQMGPVTDTSITAAGRVGTRMFSNSGTSGTTGQHFEAMRAGAL